MINYLIGYVVISLVLFVFLCFFLPDKEKFCLFLASIGWIVLPLIVVLLITHFAMEVFFCGMDKGFSIWNNRHKKRTPYISSNRDEWERKFYGK